MNVVPVINERINAVNVNNSNVVNPTISFLIKALSSTILLLLFNAFRITTIIEITTLCRKKFP